MGRGSGEREWDQERREEEVKQRERAVKGGEGGAGKREKVADRAELARGGNKSHLFFLLVFFLLFFPPPRSRRKGEREREKEAFGPPRATYRNRSGIHHCDFWHVWKTTNHWRYFAAANTEGLSPFSSVKSELYVDNTREFWSFPSLVGLLVRPFKVREHPRFCPPAFFFFFFSWQHRRIARLIDHLDWIARNDGISIQHGSSMTARIRDIDMINAQSALRNWRAESKSKRDEIVFQLEYDCRSNCVLTCMYFLSQHLPQYC